MNPSICYSAAAAGTFIALLSLFKDNSWVINICIPVNSVDKSNVQFLTENGVLVSHTEATTIFKDQAISNV